MSGVPAESKPRVPQQPKRNHLTLSSRPPTADRKWLGKNPEVVCFLLALENDRLLRENDGLRTRIKELEDQSLGGDSKFKEL